MLSKYVPGIDENPCSITIREMKQKLDLYEATLETFADEKNWEGARFIINRADYSVDDFETPIQIAKRVLGAFIILAINVG